jgi:prepilin-type N-terminal cleavage/methylation domain-containing protein
VAGVTLLEMLIVVAIIALMMSILLPSLGAAKRSTRKTVCAGYQHQLIFTDNCGTARIRLEAFDCGCYEKNLSENVTVFDKPEDTTDDEFRRQLEAGVFDACGP